MPLFNSWAISFLYASILHLNNNATLNKGGCCPCDGMSALAAKERAVHVICLKFNKNFNAILYHFPGTKQGLDLVKNVLIIVSQRLG